MLRPLRSDRDLPRTGPDQDNTSSRDVEIFEQTYRSKSLRRIQPYLCIAPAGFRTDSRRYPLLLLLHGLNGCYKDWMEHTRLARHLRGRDIIVVCPDGGNGWYTNAAGDGERREDDLVHDLLPALEADLPLLPAPARAIEGASMGGYGAVKLAMKHSNLFRCAVSHSGAVNAASSPNLDAIFGDQDRDSAFRKNESLLSLAEQALCRLPTERPQLMLDCGLNDPLLAANRAFSEHLNFIGYGHTYRELAGHHTWPYFDRAFRSALPAILAALETHRDERNPQ